MGVSRWSDFSLRPWLWSHFLETKYAMFKNSTSPRLPAAPHHLSPEARKLWRRILGEFCITDAAGLALLGTALEAHDRMRQAQSAMAKHGPVFEDRFGGLRANPACSIERDARVAFVAALKALNLEPPAPTGRPPGAHLLPQF